tara:strand:+ start:3087 stop:4427 length:1341 start_codon:yes stop_codon:yes gene_type:complete
MSVNKSLYEEFIISSGDGSTTVDIAAGVVNFTYYENLFSPVITARIVVVNTGGVVPGKDGKLQSLYNGLPLRGGERVSIKIAANSGTNQSLDFTEPTKNFYVSGIENVMIDGERESLVLNLVSREAITNETVRVGKKFSTDSNISNTVRDILKNYIKTDKINQIETTMNNYGFIGNMKKPFQILTWLASKSISGESEESSGGNSAGFFFYQTKDGFNFRSIDSLVEQEPFDRDYRYAPNVISTEDPNKDFKIIEYNINQNIDLMNKLERGAYSSQRYYINPVSFAPYINHFKSSDYVDNIKTLGDNKVEFPSAPMSEIEDDVSLGNTPTRIFTAMYDVGTLEENASKRGWNDSVERNADPVMIDAQSRMRYSLLHTQVAELVVPLNTNLSAGTIIRCEFPRNDLEKRHVPDFDSSGLYMIKELSHYYDVEGSFTRLKLLRDTYGRK